MTHTMRNRQRGPFAGVLFAATGYLGVLYLGRLAAQSGESESFAPLAIASLTALVFAPLAALVGALIAHHQYGTIRLDDRHRYHVSTALVALLVATIGVLLFVDRLAAIPVFILGLTALVLLRMTLAHRPMR